MGGPPPTNNAKLRLVQPPPSHFGWTFEGRARFEARASMFLANGFEVGERLIYVVDDPNLNQWPKTLRDGGDLLVLSTSELFGPERLVDVASQRSTFETALAEAIGDGYSGIRLAADATSLIDGPDRLAAWMRWEDEVDRLMAENPVTGLCAFDRSRVDAEALETVMSVHRDIEPPVG